MIIRRRTALITGASSGFGADFARQLAARGSSLILVARRAERLRTLADQLRREHGVQVEVIVTDLARVGAASQLFDQVRALGLAVDVLINNAGACNFGRYLDHRLEDERSVMLLNMLSLSELCHLFGRPMVERGYGRILLVSSISAYLSPPLYAVYGGTKAFVRSFGEALSHELKGTGVSCTVVAPGVAGTEFIDRSGQTRTTRSQRWTMMRSADVVRSSLRAMGRRRATFVPGLVNASIVLGTRLLPRRWVTALAGLALRSGR
jgi:short-subunit dehydrogenase